jgi:hypothetical protein
MMRHKLDEEFKAKVAWGYQARVRILKKYRQRYGKVPG